MTIDWASIEARRGRVIEPEERIRGEVDVLRWETDAMLHQADRIERMNENTQREIVEAHEHGQTHDEYLAMRQGDVDDWDDTACNDVDDDADGM